MTANDNNTDWKPCPAPKASDVVRWKEPLWAKPNKPRGKPDQIGEQMITAKVIVGVGDSFELEVVTVERLSLNPGITDPGEKIKPGDKIRRKKDSLKRGDCRKQI